MTENCMEFTFVANSQAASSQH